MEVPNRSLGGSRARLSTQTSAQPRESRPIPSGSLLNLAQRIDSTGRTHVSQRAILAQALPLMATSGIQVILNVTDIWFVGRISMKALAAVGATQLLMMTIMLAFGSGGMVVQAHVAQAFGARRYTRAAKTVWASIWATLCIAPILVALATSSDTILAPFGLDRQVRKLASEFWFPRMLGFPLAAAASAILGYFNGIGRPSLSLLVVGVSALVNTLLNQLFIFQLHWGVSGSGWATAGAQAAGLLCAIVIFLKADYRHTYKSHLTWKPRASLVWGQLRLGFTIGLLPAAELLAFSLFQLMQVRFNTVGGAATQLAAGLTSIAYVPGSGIAAAGMTIVAQSIGAGYARWAMSVGTRAILLVGLYTGGIGIALAIAGPWLLPLFVGTHETDSAAVVAMATQLLWFAAGYQFFDGLTIGSSMCLRAAGDAIVPVALALPILWVVFLPLAHSFTFPQGGGWLDFLPQFGWGTVGGWAAVLIYVMLSGSVLFFRWRSGAWHKISNLAANRR